MARRRLVGIPLLLLIWCGAFLLSCGGKKAAESTCSSDFDGSWKMECTKSSTTYSSQSSIDISKTSYYLVKKAWISDGSCTGTPSTITVESGTLATGTVDGSCTYNVDFTPTYGASTSTLYSVVRLDSTGLRTGQSGTAAGASADTRLTNLSSYFLKQTAPATFPSCSTAPPATLQTVSAGYWHTCAVVGGAAKCWGGGSGGQLGNSGIASRSVPDQVTGLTANVTVLAAGGFMSGAGDGFTCGIAGGAAKCWGLNHKGKLGDPATTASAVTSAPVAVTGLDSGVTSIATGANHACAVVGTGGAVKCWGNNGSGQLGNGTVTENTTPVQAIAALASKVAVGYNHSCALSTSGSVTCWGGGWDGQLGNSATNDSTTPVQTTGLTSGVSDLAVGDNHSCVIVSGAVKCWGSNSSGQIGNGSTTNAASPTQVTGLTSGVTAIAGGYLFSCAVVGGKVYCWGKNDQGQLGNGTTTDSATPVEVSGISSGATSVTAGKAHACAIVDSKLKCWGYNSDGALGNLKTTSSSVPVDVLWCTL